MYHAQLIRGWRYAELYSTDGLFAVIVLFCHFCIILMLFCFLDWSQADDVDHTDSSEFGKSSSTYDLTKNLRNEFGIGIFNTAQPFEDVINLWLKLI